ncbi:MAG: CBS domain-containing protein [Planctomycetota bacterium]|jgi:CBS domain-containing protein
MSKTIKDVLKEKENKVISSVGPDLSIAEAVSLLCAQRIGALMVIDENGEPTGIITERDVLMEINRNPDLVRKRKVSEVMTTNLICGLPDDEVNYAMNVMTENKIRHLPIVSDNKVIGIISIGDVIKCLLEAIQFENRNLHEYLHLKGEI